MLKVQFQFNMGKDYSGGYPSNGMYPAFAKTLPFDFWIDDVSFITGDCPTAVPATNNNSPAKPFPQNAAVGSCMPATNAAKFAANLAHAYQNWTRTFVQGNTIVAPEQQNAVTSEAMGYGMMIAAAMGDKTAFDKFHAHVKANGGSGAGNLMNWKGGQSGSASDGDIDIAYALLMAHAQWPSGGYKTASDDMASGILSKDIVGDVIRGGSSFQNSNFNASYFAPYAFRKFSGFGAAITKNYQMVNTNVGNSTAGVPTDWGNPTSGAASGPGSAQVTSEIVDGENGAMGYDAARVPWRLGLDACLGGGNTTALGQIVSLFAGKYDQGATIDLMKAGWLKTNGNPHTAAKDSQGSYIGPIGVGGMAMGNAAMRDRAFRTMLDILENGDFNHTYFPSTVGLLTALAMSGNFPTPP
jgi:endo-1,4-beta-D-glucanase Y